MRCIVLLNEEMIHDETCTFVIMLDMKIIGICQCSTVEECAIGGSRDWSKGNDNNEDSLINY